MRMRLTNNRIIVAAGIIIIFLLVVLWVMQVRSSSSGEADGSSFRYPVRMRPDLDIGGGVEF